MKDKRGYSHIGGVQKVSSQTDVRVQDLERRLLVALAVRFTVGFTKGHGAKTHGRDHDRSGRSQLAVPREDGGLLLV